MLSQHLPCLPKQAVEAAVAEEGWKMVLLLRLSPVIPFAPLNYALSLTSISFFAYAWTSALGIIPGASALGSHAPAADVSSVLGQPCATVCVFARCKGGQ